MVLYRIFSPIDPFLDFDWFLSSWSLAIQKQRILETAMKKSSKIEHFENSSLFEKLYFVFLSENSIEFVAKTCIEIWSRQWILLLIRNNYKMYGKRVMKIRYRTWCMKTVENFFLLSIYWKKKKTHNVIVRVICHRMRNIYFINLLHIFFALRWKITEETLSWSN